MTSTVTPTTPAAPTTRTQWPAYLSVVAGGVLLLKAGLIIGSGGDQLGVTGFLYLGGLLLALVAVIGLALRAPGRWRFAAAPAAALLLVAWVIGLGDTTAPLFEAIKDEPYVGDEAPIGVLGGVLVAVGLWGARQR